MKNKIIPIAVLFVLVSCGKSSSSGTKVSLEYAADGGLYEVTGAALYQMVITESRNIPFLVTLAGCSACAEAKADLSQIAVSIHTNVYYVELNPSAADYTTTYDYIYRATNEASDYMDKDGWPAIGEDYSAPAFYIMWDQWIAACVYDSFSTTLTTTCEVPQP